MDTDDFCSTACDMCGDPIHEGQPVHSGWTRGTPETVRHEATSPREVSWCDQCEDRDGHSLHTRHVVTVTHRCPCDGCQAARLLRDLRASVQVSL